MAHVQSQGHRTAAPPQLGANLSARDQYSSTTPSFRRTSELLIRSPSFPSAPLRRHQLGPTQGSVSGFGPAGGRMDSGQYGSRPNHSSVPQLYPVQTLGTLQYMDAAMTPVKVDISGTVDKGPFLSCDQEWTCYRRNYLACVCSYTLTPHYANVPMHFTAQTTSSSSSSSPSSSSGQTVQVYGFAMCISAVVAENEQQRIELVQHTPKRDKGPISKPAKVMLAPKTSGGSSHHSLASYGGGESSTVGGGRGLYGGDGFTGPQAGGQQLPTEHTFERIQFKQATQNNGKRRAAQQYYHLIVELWADVGAHSPEQYVKVAYRKSPKMIVRGRSPGHYQNERRGSQGNGPGGSAGNMGAYAGIGAPQGPPHLGDFGSVTSTMLGGGAFGPGAYDGRGNLYSSSSGGGGRQQQQHHHHHEAADGGLTPADEGKNMEVGAGANKAYQYYGGSSIYEGAQERLDLFQGRGGAESSTPSMGGESKVKSELEFHMLPRPFHLTSRLSGQRQQDGPFLGPKPASSGSYYAAMESPAEMNMTIA